MARIKSAEERGSGSLTAFFSVLSIVWVLPVFIVLFNSFKKSESIALTPFSIPDGESFVGLSNYTNGITHGNYPFYMSILYSAVITVLSVGLILICTSMLAWYITRVNSAVCRTIYYFCIFSMVVPFQMVMFTLSKTADRLSLNTPFTIPVVYLGFGAGLAVFMFCGFIKGIPMEIEQAATIDGCNTLQTFFLIDAPIMKSTYISVGILEIMWVWNDYLLPYLVLDRTRFMRSQFFFCHPKQACKAQRGTASTVLPPIRFFTLRTAAVSNLFASFFVVRTLYFMSVLPFLGVG